MTPIRRGTARRLGITQPRPAVTVYINPDLSAFQRNMREAVSVNRHVIQEAFRRFHLAIDTDRPEETP